MKPITKVTNFINCGENCLTGVMIPQKYRWILSLNPMGGIIEAFRASVLGHQPVNWSLLAISSVIAALIFISGLLYFRKVERSFADVI